MLRSWYSWYVKMWELGKGENCADRAALWWSSDGHSPPPIPAVYAPRADSDQQVLQKGWSSPLTPTPSVSASPWNLLDMHITGLAPDPWNQKL